jgi:hypothetical protein
MGLPTPMVSRMDFELERSESDATGAASHPVTTITLRDGHAVRVRHVIPGDEAALLRFMQALSPASRRLRFFSAATDLGEAARWAASADGSDRLGLVALDESGLILGHAVCCRLDRVRAEVAVEIAETQRHLGLATILIGELAAEAEQQGINAFIAEVLPDNRDMLAVFSDGFDAARTTGDGEVDIEFPTAAWRRLRSAFASVPPPPAP